MQPIEVIRPEVRAESGYHAHEPIPGAIKLDSMENPYRLPEELAGELGRRLAGVAINRYPSADPQAFKAKVARYAKVPEGASVVLGNGSDELIGIIIRACAKPGAVIMAPDPTFSMYEIEALHSGCRYVGVPLKDDFSLDLPAMLEAIRREQPAVIFMAWPANPTGNLFEREQMEAILDAAPGLVVSDEAYQPFALSTWMGELVKRPNLLVLRTFSKLGLAGIRLGYLSAPAALAAEFNKVRPVYNVNVLTLETADFLLDHVDVLEGQCAQMRADREVLVRGLSALPGVKVFRADGNFVLCRVPNADAVNAELLARGIMVKNVSHAHPLLAGCLRTAIGTPEENARLLSELSDILSKE